MTPDETLDQVLGPYADKVRAFGRFEAIDITFSSDGELTVYIKQNGFSKRVVYVPPDDLPTAPQPPAE